MRAAIKAASAPNLGEPRRVKLDIVRALRRNHTPRTRAQTHQKFRMLRARQQVIAQLVNRPQLHARQMIAQLFERRQFGHARALKVARQFRHLKRALQHLTRFSPLTESRERRSTRRQSLGQEALLPAVF